MHSGRICKVQGAPWLSWRWGGPRGEGVGAGVGAAGLAEGAFAISAICGPPSNGVAAPGPCYPARSLEVDVSLADECLARFER